jgi:chemosensory pili system protein ChpA (sensor histidine kinase/response regulator)
VRVSLARLDALMNLVGELVIARSRLDRRLAQLDRIGELLLASRARMARAIHELDRRPADEGGAGPGPSATPLTALFAELEFDRYDDVDLFRRSATEMTADLSEVQAQLAALVRAISEDTALIQRLTGQLREEITHARMVPVGRLFARFARQVREAGRAAGKAVLLQTSGEAVEVDNTIVEQIADPLLHLIQNAIAHGIEPAAERRARGKPEEGVVRLGAFHRGGFVHVRVEDDGGGVDVARLRAEAVRQGRLTAEAAAGLSDREALDLMFEPGFSTAAAVTTAAGRGVGLDVVRTNVGRLNGEIEVETEPGAGTRFTLKVPLTLVISDALLVWAGDTLFAIPLAAVRFVVQVRPAEVQRHGRTERIRVEDQPVDLIRLDRVLGLAGAEPPPVLPVVVLRAGARSVGLAVSRLGGKEEIVIKTLAGGLDVGPFAGATISGEGRVILLLDAVRLVELAERLAAGGPAAGRRAAAAATPAAARPAEARRVLLVDDSVSVRKFVGHMLERAGFVVVTANDGVEALARLQEVSVDVVITDLEMPRMNGYELIEDLRHRASARGVPIVVLTTRAGEKHESLARRLGVEHYVTKPVDEHAFVRLIESLTTRGPVEAAALSGTAR